MQPNMRWLIITNIFVLSLIAGASFFAIFYLNKSSTDWSNLSIGGQKKEKVKPLEKFSIANLQNYPFKADPDLKIVEEFAKNEGSIAYKFEYQTYGKKMSGLINIPNSLENSQKIPVIIMIRGYVPPEIYQPGVGTKNAAINFAKNGYITIAPDFFSFGTSDKEPADSWEARFIKPINVIELIKTIQNNPQIKIEDREIAFDASKIGIWAHSNGGQIALTTLEVLGVPLPTTLWAPVTAPFPYSLLYFSDENEDEGKGLRLWISQFEKDYNAFDFSLTRHLDLLAENLPLQLHHGTADDSALKAWSDEFVAKIKTENKQRKTASKKPINVEYFVYPNANHNMQPGWDAAITRDNAFFAKYLR